MTHPATMSDHVVRFVAMKQHCGYRFTTNARTLQSFARFAENRNETFIHSETVLDWVLAPPAASPTRRASKLHTVHALACWLHAEDASHEIPPHGIFGSSRYRRPSPHLVSVPDIRQLLTAALCVRPAGTIAPLTWHYMFGLVASTGLRIGEARALKLDDITADGLIIRDTKFRKTRMVGLHPSTRNALNRYLMARRKEKTPDDHVFVIATGRPPSRKRTSTVFRKLAEQVGLREPGSSGPTLHSLRHSFAVRSLEKLDPSADPQRHMLALATYLGHATVSGTYWYLESTPVLLRGIAQAAEEAHSIRCGGSHD